MQTSSVTTTLNAPIARLCIYIQAYILIAGPFMQDFRLTHIAEIIPNAQFYAIFPLETLGFILWMLLRKDVDRYKMDWIELMIIFLAVWGGFMTIIYLGNSDLSEAAGNFIRLFLVYFSYRCGRDILSRESPATIWRLQNFWGRMGAWGIVFGNVFLYGAIIFHHPGYLGLPTEVAFIPFAVLLVGKERNRNRILWLLALMVLIGGKRGNILSIIAMLFVYGYFTVKGGHMSAKLLRNTGLGFLFLALATGAVIATGSVDFMSNFVPAPIAARFATLSSNDEEGGVDLSQATAGRNYEVEDVLEQWHKDPSAAWTGMGLGAQITYPNGLKENTVHISPLALSHIYGFIVGLTFFITALWTGVNLFITARPGIVPQSDIVWALLATALLTTSLSVYIIMQNPLIWLALGALAGRKRALATTSDNLSLSPS